MQAFHVLQNARVYANNSICIQSHRSKCKPSTCFKMPEYMLIIQFAFSHAAPNASLPRASKCQSILMLIIQFAFGHAAQNVGLSRASNARVYYMPTRLVINRVRQARGYANHGWRSGWDIWSSFSVVPPKLSWDLVEYDPQPPPDLAKKCQKFLGKSS
jgi:hypothetical protein